MKKYLAAISVTTLIGVAPFALAASSVDLTVTGTITPAACMPSFSDGGVVDFGKIQAKDLNQTTHTTLPKTPIALNVTCDAPVLFALIPVDNKPGTSFNNQGFGLGMTDANEKVGSFTPQVRSVVADGQAARAIDSSNNGTTWVATSWVFPDRLMSVGAVGTLVPIAAQNVLMNVDLNAWIARADGLTLTDEVAFTGSATFEMTYL
ncbi:DUF1120 domain-containing protein [Pseudomonas sp. PCH199]|uniref:DUF1120 domain-containing protein n=1 Tax=unclassified Pseudomonas TaxID=196821 RepID=UPI000BC6A16A|nr:MULTISPECIES: DUF1120 domain-containing protein [unclassified Pseudomonas]MCW8275290.1 DUF1120 domain-containing protein [Pseudomonas sp. PCH199]PAM84170.1 hypothetical protein CES87_06100 [Pseudomonas sp. ERMR1:02]